MGTCETLSKFCPQLVDIVCGFTGRAAAQRRRLETADGH